MSLVRIDLNVSLDGYASGDQTVENPMGEDWARLVSAYVATRTFQARVLGATDGRAPTGFAPIAIGLALTLIHLISIPVSNTSVNPARSTAVAFFNGAGAPAQLWAFWVAPIVGAAIAGATFQIITGVNRDKVDISGEPRA